MSSTRTGHVRLQHVFVGSATTSSGAGGVARDGMVGHSAQTPTATIVANVTSVWSDIRGHTAVRRLTGLC